MMLTFDESAHRYFWNGKPVPGVTSILSPLVDFSGIPAATLETARQKGQAIHKMVELHVNGDLDEPNLPEWMKPVLERWCQFARETGFKVIDSEKRVHHPQYGYAGTLDLYGDSKLGIAYIDVKRSFMAGAVTGLQLAAYKEADCVAHRERNRAKRFALRLNETGPYRIEEFTDKGDLQIFLSLLNLRRWKEKHQP